MLTAQINKNLTQINKKISLNLINLGGFFVNLAPGPSWGSPGTALGARASPNGSLGPALGAQKGVLWCPIGAQDPFWERSKNPLIFQSIFKSILVPF